ncbi:MAG: hypothetical protein ACOC8D_02070, partial [bacterium]
ALHRGPAPHPAWLPAVGAYEAALQRDPLRPSLHFQLGRALEKLGDRPAACRHARRALDLHARLVQRHPAHVLRLSDEQLVQARALKRRTCPGREAP